MCPGPLWQGAAAAVTSHTVFLLIYCVGPLSVCLYFKQHIAEQSVLKDASDADCFLIISPFPCFDVIDLFVVGFCLLVVVFSDGTLLECA